MAASLKPNIMQYDFPHNYEMDITPVMPNLSIVLSDLNETLKIKDTGVVITDNGIESTSEIIGKARDPFQVIKHEQYLLSSIEKHTKKSTNSNQSVNPTGENS